LYKQSRLFGNAKCTALKWRSKTTINVLPEHSCHYSDILSYTRVFGESPSSQTECSSSAAPRQLSPQSSSHLSLPRAHLQTQQNNSAPYPPSRSASSAAPAPNKSGTWPCYWRCAARPSPNSPAPCAKRADRDRNKTRAEMGNCYLKKNQLPTTLPIASILSSWHYQLK